MRSWSVAIAAAAVLLAGCGEPSAPPVDPTAQAVCDALRSDDLANVEGHFARAHDGLHELGRTLPDRGERALAGDLLEAKQRVEALVAEDAPDLDALHEALAELFDVTARAVTVDGGSAPTCDPTS